MTPLTCLWRREFQTFEWTLWSHVGLKFDSLFRSRNLCDRHVPAGLDKLRVRHLCRIHPKSIHIAAVNGAAVRNGAL